MRQGSGAAHRGGSRRSAFDPAAAVAALADLDPSDLDEAEALEAITSLEQLKRAACAAQARLAVRVDELARRRQRAAGRSGEQLGAGVGAQIALARLESPHRGSRHLGLAKTLHAELPEALRRLARGEVSEWQVTLVARETACLDPDTRRAIDERIAGRLSAWGDAQTVREVRRLAQAADPGAAAARQARAVSERCVTIRPAPDTMCYLTTLVPAVQGWRPMRPSSARPTAGGPPEILGARASSWPMRSSSGSPA